MNSINTDDLKKIQLDILKAVAKFCDDNNLTYYLTGGTLIGAVRHHGFIPWDDDIDVNMRRSDYKYFFEHFNDQNSNYHAICIENNEEYYLANGKVFDKRTFLMEDANNAIPIGVNIDIFPLDTFPDDLSVVKSTYKKVKKYQNILSIKTIKINQKRSLVKNGILFCGQIIFKGVQPRVLLKKISSLSQKYNHLENNRYIAAMSTMIYGMKEVFEASDFESTVKLKFEDSWFTVPVGYDRVLRSVYGNYMQLPPIEDQVTHHAYAAYWKKD